jgi:hypothetical protein
MHGGACSERPAQVIFTKGKGTGSCRVGDGIRSPEGGADFAYRGPMDSQSPAGA